MKDALEAENKILANKTCPCCETVFTPRKPTSKYCSRKCLWSQNGGRNKKLITWWKNQRGYIEGRIWISDKVQVRVKQHRWIMEGYLGRPLLPTEDVHHINEIRDDNRPENLEILSHGEHAKKHNGNRIYRTGYTLNLSIEERERRSMNALMIGLSQLGLAAIAKATGETK